MDGKEKLNLTLKQRNLDSYIYHGSGINCIEDQESGML